MVNELKDIQSFNIYCDESRQTNPDDTYMVIGAISCRRDQKAHIFHKINTLKKEHRVWPEFGWKKISENRKDFYMSMIDLFLFENPLAFRCIVVDRNVLDHETYNRGDEELGFYKIYYQMLIHWLKPGHTYSIYCDTKFNKIRGRFIDLRDIMRRKLSGKARIMSLEQVSSTNQPLIQLADLFTGAVGYSWNGRTGSEFKLEFCNELATKIGLSGLNVTTKRTEEKFNIFNFIGR